MGPGTFDDSNPGFIYTGAWSIYPGPEPYRSTLHYTTTPGSSVTTTINGYRFILVYTANPNRGWMDIYIDNIKVATLNQYGPSVEWRYTWNSPSLSYGIHIIKFVNVSPNTAYYVDIDAIIVPDAVLPPTSTRNPSGIYEPTSTSTDTPTLTPTP